MKDTTNTLIFNVTEHRNNNSGCDYNLFAEMLQDQGAVVRGEDTDNGVIMYISGLDLDVINDIANDAGITDVLDYIDDNTIDESVDMIDECDDLDECNEDAPYFDEFSDDLELFTDSDTEFDDEDDIETPEYPSYEEVAGIEDIDMIDDVEADVEDDYIEDDTTLGWEEELSEYDDVIEEAFNSRRVRGRRNHRLNEKKKGCCPPKRKLNENGDNILQKVYDYLVDEDYMDYNSDTIFEEDVVDACLKFGIPDKVVDNYVAIFAKLYNIKVLDYNDEVLYESRKFNSRRVRSRRNRRLNESREEIQLFQNILQNINKQYYDTDTLPICFSNNDVKALHHKFVTAGYKVAYIQINELNHENFGLAIKSRLKNAIPLGPSSKPTVLWLDNVDKMQNRVNNDFIFLIDQRKVEVDNKLYDVDVPIICSYENMPEWEHAMSDRVYWNDANSVYESQGFNGRRLKNKNNLISLTEALKSFDEKDQKKLDKVKMSVDDILKMVKGQSIGERESREAFAKLKKEQNAIKKIKKSETDNFSVLDIPGVTKAIKAMIAADPEKAAEIKKFRESLVESVVTALATKKKSLHENAVIRGKKFNTISYKEMQKLYESVIAKKKELTKKLKMSDVRSAEGQALKESIAKKNKTIMYLSEELAYRQVAANVFKRLNEDEEAKEDTKQDDQPSMDDLAAMFGSSDMSADSSSDDDKDNSDDNTDSEGENVDEETEEVELSRVVIEMATKEDAEQLMTLCKDAGIPEEAMEIETGNEDDEDVVEDVTDDSETADDSTDEETDNADTEDDGTKNESIRYSNLRRLFEADGEDEGDADDTADSDEADSETDDTVEGDDTEATEDEGSVKFVLTDSDYVNELAGVLSDEYGISEEEFENMIGGEIVETDDDSEGDSDDDTFEEGDDKSDSKDDEAEEDDIDAADIFGNM